MAEDDTEHFSLRWNNFHNNLTAGFHALLQGEDLVDVTLAAGGKFVQAHKMVLSVCSPYFKELFKINPCKHPIVILKDVSYKDLVAILHFMYKGEANVRQEELSAFLKTAETLQIKGLTGDDSANEDNDIPVQSRVASPPAIKANDRAYKRHSVSTLHRPLVPPSPPPARKRPKVETAVPVVPVPPPVIQPARENSTEFVAVTIPKTEPVDYESDIEVLDVKSDPLVHLLQGETSQSHHDDTDSHQSNFDASDTNLDSSQSHLEDSQSHMDPNQSLLDTSQGSSGMFSGIAGLSHSQDGASQDGSQGDHAQSFIDLGMEEFQGPKFTCTICNKFFKRMKTLRQHERNIHGDLRGPFQCSMCQRWLKNNNTLHVHRSECRKQHVVLSSGSQCVKLEIPDKK